MLEITNKHYTFLIKDSNFGQYLYPERVIPIDLEYLKKYLNNPQYKIEFRECSSCSGTYKEAYDFVSEHVDDYFETWEWVMESVDYSAAKFIEQRICEYITESEDIEDLEEDLVPSFELSSWNDKIESFAWDRVLTEEEINTIKQKYSL